MKFLRMKEKREKNSSNYFLNRINNFNKDKNVLYFITKFTKQPRLHWQLAFFGKN